MHDPDQKTDAETLDEELVAYLDGELNAEAARHVEQRLATDAPARRRLQQLAQSWDLLDRLPRATVDESFTRSTVEMVAVSAEKELSQQTAAEPERRRRQWFYGAATVLAAGLAGFLLVSTVRPDPNEQLLRDLPVVENVEVYRQTDDIDFLHKLNSEGLFNEEVNDAP